MPITITITVEHSFNRTQLKSLLTTLIRKVISLQIKNQHRKVNIDEGFDYYLYLVVIE